MGHPIQTNKLGMEYPAIPEKMTCEFGDCTCTVGRDYVRNENDDTEDGWEDEPIYLCDEHKGNHKPINNT